jgi:hypothetical protein
MPKPGEEDGAGGDFYQARRRRPRLQRRQRDGQAGPIRLLPPQRAKRSAAFGRHYILIVALLGVAVVAIGWFLKYAATGGST